MFQRVLYTCVALLGAGLCSQFPEFYQQYLQRLGGRLDEARERVAEITVDAQDYGLSIPEYIDRFTESEPHSLEGARMQESFELVLRMDEAVSALSEAPAWARPLTFTKYFHRGTAEGAYRAFVPAVPLSLEGLSYGAAGAGLFAMLLGFLSAAFGAIRRAPKTESGR